MTVERKIASRMSDGREYTINDIATILKLKRGEAKLAMRSMVMRGLLTSDTVQGDQLYRKASP